MSEWLASLERWQFVGLLTLGVLTVIAGAGWWLRRELREPDEHESGNLW